MNPIYPRLDLLAGVATVIGMRSILLLLSLLLPGLAAEDQAELPYAPLSALAERYGVHQVVITENHPGDEEFTIQVVDHGVVVAEETSLAGVAYIPKVTTPVRPGAVLRANRPKGSMGISFRAGTVDYNPLYAHGRIPIDSLADHLHQIKREAEQFDRDIGRPIYSNAMFLEFNSSNYKNFSMKLGGQEYHAAFGSMHVGVSEEMLGKGLVMDFDHDDIQFVKP